MKTKKMLVALLVMVSFMLSLSSNAFAARPVEINGGSILVEEFNVTTEPGSPYIYVKVRHLELTEGQAVYISGQWKPNTDLSFILVPKSSEETISPKYSDEINSGETVKLSASVTETYTLIMRIYTSKTTDVTVVSGYLTISIPIMIV